MGAGGGGGEGIRFGHSQPVFQPTKHNANKDKHYLIPCHCLKQLWCKTSNAVAQMTRTGVTVGVVREGARLDRTHAVLQP